MGATFFAFTIGIATITAAMLGIKAKNKMNQINKEWPTHRCKPSTMMMSFLPFMAPKGVDASANFKDCMFGMNKSFFDTLMSPFMTIINLIHTILKKITNQIQSVRNMFDSIRTKLQHALSNIIDKIYSAYERIAWLFKTLFKIFGKVFYVFEQLFDLLLYSFYTLASVWNGPIGAAGRYFCFDENTKILTMNGYKKIKKIKVNDVLIAGNKVLGKFKFDIQDTEMYNYKGILISGSHLVRENNKWIRVEKSENGFKIEKYDKKYIYCLYTTNSVIQTDKAIFRDYFETNNEVVNKKIFKSIQLYVNEKTLKKLKYILLNDNEFKYKIYPWCFSNQQK